MCMCMNPHQKNTLPPGENTILIQRHLSIITLTYRTNTTPEAQHTPELAHKTRPNLRTRSLRTPLTTPPLFLSRVDFSPTNSRGIVRRVKSDQWNPLPPGDPPLLRQHVPGFEGRGFPLAGIRSRYIIKFMAEGEPRVFASSS